MSSIPLPALAVNTQGPSPIDQAAKVALLHNSMNNQQLTQADLQQKNLQNSSLAMQLKGMQAMRAAEASPEWDPRDLDGALQIMRNHGVPTDIAKNTIAGISQIREGLSKASTETLSAIQASHGFLDDQLQSLKDAPIDQKQNAYTQVLNNAKQYANNLPPGPARQQFLGELGNVPTLYDQGWVNEQHARLRSLQYLTDEAKTNAQTREAAGKGYQAEAEGNLAIARTPGAQAESTMQQQSAQQTPQERALNGNLFYGAAGGDDQARAALNLETGQKVAVAQAGVANVPAGLRGVAPHLVGPAAAAAEKAGNEYGDAVAAANDMKTFVDLAKSGNKVAYAYSPTEGVLTLNTARGVKRVNMAEIGSYSGAGSALDRVKAFLGKQTSGASVPDDVLNDMENLHESIAANAQTTYSNKLKNTNATYGSSFQPVNMGGPPAGATGKAKGSDGKWHWTDGKRDLGAAE